jgi:hypothetical protein
MRFTLRLLKPKDFHWCASILEDGFERHSELRGKLPELWSGLMAIDALSMIVIVDDDQSDRVAFGAAAIISDECLEMTLASTQPNFALRVLMRELEAKSSHARPFVMRLQDIRALNHPKHGVNLAVLHYSEVLSGYRAEEVRLVRDKALHALLELQRGYALKEFLMEVYGEQDLPFAKAMGLRVRADYPHQAFPAWRRPLLFGMRRDEVAEQWGSPVATLFSYAAPVFFFSITQQRILLRACQNDRDADIASELGIETTTLREHWRAIFAKVEAGQKRFGLSLEHLPDFAVVENRSRAVLVPYLKQHPEELRPADPRNFRVAQESR